MPARWWGVELGLLLVAASCSPPPPSKPVSSAVGEPAPISAEQPAPPQPVSEPDAGSDQNAPSFDEEMKCRREHCYVGGAARCLQICHEYNHPRRPQQHEACNEGCRRSYGIVECEQACALDRRAFAPKIASPVGSCSSAVPACREECSHRKDECELSCLAALRECEAKPPH